MDFMKGYLRPPEMVDELVDALRDALHANPTQRMGQLLSNLTRNSDHDLFNVYDEVLTDLLRASCG